MNKIEAFWDKSDYEIYDDYLNYRLDGYWLDEKLYELYPGNMYKGTVPTLLFWLEVEKEREIVWNRIFPRTGNKSICPILMCPDDADFSCTLIVAEIENIGTNIIWSKIGVDRTKEREPDKIGSAVEWFDKVESLTFEYVDYENMISKFREQLIIHERKWQEENTRENLRGMN